MRQEQSEDRPVAGTEGPLRILVRYHAEIPSLEKRENGDWIDLYAAEDVELKQGEWKAVSLGVSMKLPEGYEAHVLPRSSTFRRWGVLQVNAMGIIDESYCGDGDIWYFQALAVRDTVIRKGDRICQFRILRKMPPVVFERTDALTGPDRGGLGSTGDR